MSEWVKEVVTEHAKSLGHGVESERLSFSPCSDIYYLYSQEGVTLPLWTSVSSSAKTLLLNRVVIRVKWHNAWKELKIRPGSEWSSGNISDYHNCFQQGLWWEELRKTGGIYLFPSNSPQPLTPQYITWKRRENNELILQLISVVYFTDCIMDGQSGVQNLMVHPGCQTWMFPQ